MTHNFSYLIGVDGGGTGTRLALADEHGVELLRATAGPSGLINGAESAWNAIMLAMVAAFAALGKPVPPLAQLAIGLGLAGVHNSQWASQFADQNPGFGILRLDTDGYTTVLGAHQGQPGGIVAIGTGSVAEALLPDGQRCEVGGWGFPCGDEASGAWMGIQAVNHIQQVLDGRLAGSAFSLAVIQHCGGGRVAVFHWLGQATQRHYAQLAPLVLAHAGQGNDAVAENILQQAGKEIAKMAYALDKTNTLPIALCGGLAESLEAYVPAELRSRLVVPAGDAVAGALLLIKKALNNP